MACIIHKIQVFMYIYLLVIHRNQLFNFQIDLLVMWRAIIVIYVLNYNFITKKDSIINKSLVEITKKWHKSVNFIPRCTDF